MSDTTTVPEPTGAPGFSIAVPGDWIVVNLELAADPGLVGGLIDAQIANGALKAESRQEAVRIVTRIIDQAANSGVRFAAALVAEDDEGPLVASVTLSVARLLLPDLAEVGTADLDDLEVTLNRPLAVEADDAADTIGVGTATNTQMVLPVAPAVRVERVMSYRLTETLSQDVYSVQYVVPIDEDGLTFTITGVSPAMRRKSDLDRVFAEIADTLRLERTA